MTWHGPGQSVLYVIADVRAVGARRLVGALVEAMVAASGVTGARCCEAAAVGCYVEGRKLGSVGVRIARGVSTHGLALNRDPDPMWFTAMTACGAPGVPGTSIAREGGDPDRRRVDEGLVAEVASRLGLSPTEWGPDAAGPHDPPARAGEPLLHR